MPAELTFPSAKEIYSYLERHPKTQSYFKGTTQKDPSYLIDEEIIKRITQAFAARVVEMDWLSIFIRNDLCALQDEKRKAVRSFSQLVIDLNISLKDCGSGVPIYIAIDNHNKTKKKKPNLSDWEFFI